MPDFFAVLRQEWRRPRQCHFLIPGLGLKILRRRQQAHDFRRRAFRKLGGALFAIRHFNVIRIAAALRQRGNDFLFVLRGHFKLAGVREGERSRFGIGRRQLIRGDFRDFHPLCVGRGFRFGNLVVRQIEYHARGQAAAFEMLLQQGDIGQRGLRQARRPHVALRRASGEIKIINRNLSRPAIGSFREEQPDLRDHLLFLVFCGGFLRFRHRLLICFRHFRQRRGRQRVRQINRIGDEFIMILKRDPNHVG